MSNTTHNLSLPYIQGGQAQKHVTHNEAIRTLDTVVQLSVIEQAATPPANPQNGARYVVATGGALEFSGRDTHVATWDGSAWTFVVPQSGWIAFDQSSGSQIVFSGGAWAPLGSGGTVTSATTFGVNATADSTNRLAVSADAVLLSHDTNGGHQLKVNKSTASDSASLLFQTGWSGRAEFGTTGSDDFAIKLSADGSTWIDAIQLDADTGAVSGISVQQSASDTSDGRLALASYVYGPGNVVGPVSENAGLPTGAVIERGSNAHGEFVRFADGTLICMSEVVMDVASTNVQAFQFPSAFATTPAVSASHASDTPNSAVEMSNLRSLRGEANAGQSWRITLKAAGTVSADTSEDRLVLQATGRWF